MDICKKTKDQIIYKINYTFQKWPRHNNKYNSTKNVNQQALAMLAFPVTTHYYYHTKPWFVLYLKY